MIHKILIVGPLQCNCSILGDETSHEAIVVDPGDNISRIVAELEKHQLTVKQIVITHAHIDHIAGALQLKRLTGAPNPLQPARSAPGQDDGYAGRLARHIPRPRSHPR